MPNCIDDLLEFSGHALTREEATAIMDGVMRAYRKGGSVQAAEAQIRRATRDFVPGDDAVRAFERAADEDYQPSPYTPEQLAEQRLSPRDDGERVVTNTPPDLKGVKKNKRRFLKNAQPKNEGDAEALIDASGLPDESPKTNAEAWNEAAVKAHEEAVTAKEKQLRLHQLQLDANMRLSVERARLGGGIKAAREVLIGSVETNARALTNKYWATIGKEVEAFTKDPSVRAMDEQSRDTALIDAIMNNDALQQGNPFQRLAFAYLSIKNNIFTRQNVAGADIKYVKGHISQRDLWSPVRVRTFGLNARELATLAKPTTDNATRFKLRARARRNFAEYVAPHVDPSRLINPDGTAVDVIEFLEAAWDSIATGGATSSVSASQQSLAQKLGQQREVWLKDAKSFVEINKAFGRSDIYTMLHGEIERGARNIAMLESLGPNPSRGYRQLVAEATEHQATLTPGNPTKGSFTLENIWAEISGGNRLAEGGVSGIDEWNRYEVVARTMKGARNLVAVSKLGYLPLSQVTDIATFHVMARVNGLGGADEITSIIKGYRGGDVKAEMEELGLVVNAFQNDLTLRFTGDTGTGEGWTDSLGNFGYKVTGAKRMTDAMKHAAQLLISLKLAKIKKTAWENIDPRHKQMLELYRIDAEDWKIIQESKTDTIAGKEVVTPVTVGRHVPKELMGDDVDLAKRTEARIRSVEEKLYGLMSEEADTFVLTPGVYERAFMKGGTKAGTVAGDVFWRNFMLFKSFSVTMLTKIYPRIMRAQGKEWNGPAGIFTEFIILNTIAGGLALQLKTVVSGQEPKDMKDPKFWLAAFLQGGGIGIFGDFLFKSTNRFGQSIFSTVAGPVWGSASDAIVATKGNVDKAVAGEETRFIEQSAQWLHKNTPLIGTWYAKLALDHLIFLRLQEAANPGYRQRMEERVERDGGHWWYPPTEDLPSNPPNLERALGED